MKKKLFFKNFTTLALFGIAGTWATSVGIASLRGASANHPSGCHPRAPESPPQAAMGQQPPLHSLDLPDASAPLLAQHFLVDGPALWHWLDDPYLRVGRGRAQLQIIQLGAHGARGGRAGGRR